MISLGKTRPNSGQPAIKFAGGFITALAPMQDVTGRDFMHVIAERGPPDLFFTEFFRVHKHSKLDPGILSSITENQTQKPIFAQVIGENLDDLKRTALDLQRYPISGVDLNMGCPAPRVYRKNVGGGLLREPAKINQILTVLRESVEGCLSVKMRFGFEDDRNFEEILTILDKHQIDLLSIHARTVKGGYRMKPEYSYVKKASRTLKCPVLLNGSVESFEDAVNLSNSSGARGVMIGRAAIRNPWVFRQIGEHLSGLDVFRPLFADLYEYLIHLYEILDQPNLNERKVLGRMKKFLNFVGLGVDPKGEFLFSIRRSNTQKELFETFERFLLLNGKREEEMPLSPFSGLVARPSCEA